jgi:hypothetical protein
MMRIWDGVHMAERAWKFFLMFMTFLRIFVLRVLNGYPINTLETILYGCGLAE